MRPQRETIESTLNMPQLNRLLEIMINNTNLIFNDSTASHLNADDQTAALEHRGQSPAKRSQGQPARAGHARQQSNPAQAASRRNQTRGSAPDDDDTYERPLPPKPLPQVPPGAKPQAKLASRVTRRAQDGRATKAPAASSKSAGKLPSSGSHQRVPSQVQAAPNRPIPSTPYDIPAERRGGRGVAKSTPQAPLPPPPRLTTPPGRLARTQPKP